MTETPTAQKPLRLWPGVLIVALQWLGRFVVPAVFPEAALYGILGALVAGVVLLAWWLFFSRAPWTDRLVALAVMVVALVVTPFFLHESITTGAQGMLFLLYAIPILSLTLVVWAVAGRRLAAGPRRATMVAAILLATGVFTLLRTEGFTGSGDSDWEWRWAMTHEERLLAQAGEVPVVPVPAPAPVPETEPAAPATGAGQAPAAQEAADPEPEEPEEAEQEPAETDLPAPEGVGQEGEDQVSAGPEPERSEPARPAPEWPGFRGPGRDAVASGTRLATDWAASPPVELWRRPIGPGWSSFAVDDGRFYTQEQRGEHEVVACYDATTGEPLWYHGDAARFWESNAGAGPRGTPAIAHGRVYSFGATGIVNALDARDGTVVWSRDAAADAEKKVPGWGFSSSPLVLGELVIVAVSGRLVAYDAATGEPRWLGPEGGVSYSSPHLATIGGVEQVLVLSTEGASSVAPADGALLWRHEWSGYPIVQPALIAGGDVLISVSDQSGLRRLHPARGPGGWSVEERWTSIRLKPYFNDFVVHEGHAYGFDGSILAAIAIEDGERRWKGGRYGHGQLVLLPEQDLLLVLSEQGELVLVGATPDSFTEHARHPAIEGKTWNHPVLVGDLLLVRNGTEMAAFRLPHAGG